MPLRYCILSMAMCSEMKRAALCSEARLSWAWAISNTSHYPLKSKSQALARDTSKTSLT